MPLPLVELSHFTASLVGLLLLLLSQAVARRIDAAFYITSAALAIGSTASLVKGGDFEEATILATVLVILVASRRFFTRRARVFASPLSPGWLVAVSVVVAASIRLGFFAYQHIAYSNDLWWRFEFDADAPRFLRASIGVTVATLVVGVRELLRPTWRTRPATGADTMTSVEAAIGRQPRATANLAYLGDKSLLWNADRTAFVMYAVCGRSAVALGDPVGPPECAHSLITQFLQMCDRFGLTPAVYETSPDRLADYADHGLASVKIGEEARVPLESFSLNGPPFKQFRSALSRMAREGRSFRVIDAGDVEARLPELRDVSDEWLATKHASEKGFSLGYFKEEYLTRFPTAIIEHNGRIEAFANLWTVPSRAEVSPDLMRQRACAPPGTMDALFAHSMLWARDQGYEWFNLGMAPLSGLPPSPVRRTWARFGQFVYRHGEAFYNFRGLRAYKEKFNPVWEARYLVYPGGLTLPRALADIVAVIAGGYKRIFLPGNRRTA